MNAAAGRREITPACCHGMDPTCQGPDECARRGWVQVGRMRTMVQMLEGLNAHLKRTGIFLNTSSEERDVGKVGAWHALIVLIVCITVDMVARTIWGTP